MDIEHRNKRHPFKANGCACMQGPFYATGDFPSAIAATVIASLWAWNGLPFDVGAFGSLGKGIAWYPSSNKGI